MPKCWTHKVTLFVPISVLNTNVTLFVLISKCWIHTINLVCSDIKALNTLVSLFVLMSKCWTHWWPCLFWYERVQHTGDLVCSDINVFNTLTLFVLISKWRTHWWPFLLWYQRVEHTSDLVCSDVKVFKTHQCKDPRDWPCPPRLWMTSACTSRLRPACPSGKPVTVHEVNLLQSIR